MNIELIQTLSKELASKGEALLATKPNNEQELSAYAENCKVWVTECCEMYKAQLPEEFNDFFTKAFKESSGAIFRVPDINVRTRQIHSDIKDKISRLKNYIKMIETADMIVNPEIVLEEERNKFTIKQKELLILYKLHQHGDYDAHEVNYILWSNGIKTTDYREVVGMVKSWEEIGYIKTLPTARSVFASITTEGKKYIEELINEVKIEKQEKTTSKDEIDSINKRLDEVTDYLKRNEMGNEILFDELQELKDAGSKLDLKNWKQLVKGKIFDMSIEATVGLGIEELKELLKRLTGEDITKLLK